LSNQGSIGEGSTLAAFKTVASTGIKGLINGEKSLRGSVPSVRDSIAIYYHGVGSNKFSPYRNSLAASGRFGKATTVARQSFRFRHLQKRVEHSNHS
jgi:hypothetical protein